MHGCLTSNQPADACVVCLAPIQAGDAPAGHKQQRPASQGTPKSESQFRDTFFAFLVPQFAFEDFQVRQGGG